MYYPDGLSDSEWPQEKSDNTLPSLPSPTCEATVESSSSSRHSPDAQPSWRRWCHSELFGDSSSDDSDFNDFLQLRTSEGDSNSGSNHSDREDAPLSDLNTYEVAEDDLLYACLDNLLVADSQDSEATLDPGCVPQAFLKDPLIRRVYIQAFISAAFHGATQELVKYFLDGQHQLLSTLSQRTGLEIPGLDTMARTIRTVERRLGVDPDQRIIYYLLCDKCWARRLPSQLNNLPPECLEAGCDGAFFKVKTASDSQKYRVLIKPLPTTSLFSEIQRILLRPGKHAELNKWRCGEDDAPDAVPPVPQEEWQGSLDPLFRMFDMFDGWAWHAICAGLEQWHAEMTLKADTILAASGPTSDKDVTFIAVAIPSFSHVAVTGIRYGIASVQRGKHYHYAYINGREPVEIQQILQVSALSPNGKLLIANLAVPVDGTHALGYTASSHVLTYRYYLHSNITTGQQTLGLIHGKPDSSTSHWLLT
ncbi:hypothetical protein PYCCODRAFT_1428192 [Trametes coccinea BRFM310]|uniref:Uncharacterized protein n=1 Tax=Trametes coccinea (strain BRFM310) TaxID=1353009 RepID=A0A1Y2IBQ9_TRAC3|nr:hypothetical protein PYCCODRAFT_1428192 [Trametes coccinea BRFM310]